MENVLKTLERQKYQNIMYDLLPMPQISLPRHWFGLKKSPTNTTPAAWREAFMFEFDSAKDATARLNFNRLLKLIDIAEECGAISLNFKMNFEGGCKSMTLVGIHFPPKTLAAMMHEFHSRLKEIS